MKKELFEELVRSVQEMKEIRAGRLKPSRVFAVEEPADIIRTRARLRLSQRKFAQLLGISENTLQNWEQGRRRPTGPAKVLLKVAARHPEVILESAA
jgi:putative transcriptional regulator